MARDLREIRERIESRISEFQTWRSTQSLSASRLVQYCGVECLGGIDISVDEAEQRVRESLNEGFQVDWRNANRCLYLCVYESLDEPPNWEKVIAEQRLVDVEEILRAAGFPPRQK